jgi:hypothetical protein
MHDSELLCCLGIFKRIIWDLWCLGIFQRILWDFVVFGELGYYYIVNVTTLALGSRLRQVFAKVQAKSEARESHFMLLGL